MLETPGPFDPKTEVVGIDHDGRQLAIELAALDGAIEVEVGGKTFTVTPTGPGAAVTDSMGSLVVSEQSFWFAWYANHPDTDVWQPSE
ncbi:MAG: hypothetical protein R2710_08875 [Acidimicrobiales bacterium]